MKIENQCCSLEQAKRLNELDIIQNTPLFFWIGWRWQGEKEVYEWKTEPFHSDFLKGENDGRVHAAFTVAELGVMLPKDLYVPYKGNSGKKRKYPQHLHCFKQIRYCINYTGGGSLEHLTQQGETEAQARAAMLIYLLENNLITANEVNERLQKS